MREKTLNPPQPKSGSLASKLSSPTGPRGFSKPTESLPQSESIKQPFLDLQRLNQMAEDQEASLKDTKEAIRQKTTECVEMLERHGLKNAKLEGIGTVFILESTHVNVSKAAQEALYEELRERGFGDVIRTEPSVHSSSLKALVNELREAGEPMLKNCTAYFEKKISVRK